MRNPVSRGVTALALGAFVALSAGPFKNAQGAQPAPVRGDDWTEEQLSVLATLRLSELAALPDDPSNAWQNSAAAAALGKKLFFDTRFSGNGAVACATCHDPSRQFQDGRPVGKGVGTGTRRSMPIVASGYGSWLFWDGRKDSLWSQALGPLEDPLEHGGNRLQYARLMQQHYGQAYSELFGPLPDFSNLPDDASPAGSSLEQTNWWDMDESAREAVSRVFANMGKAIAAYERTLRHEPSRLDRYITDLLDGKRQAESSLTPREVRGLRLFIGKGQCLSCHDGPLLTDQQFHNTGVPPRDAKSPDSGRAAAVAKIRADEFNCIGRYSDARPEQCQELRFLADGEENAGAFKTPGLRGVATRPPYMHAGQFAALEEVLRHYVDAPQAAMGRSELNSLHGRASRSREGRQPIRLTAAEQQDLVAFLHAL